MDPDVEDPVPFIDISNVEDNKDVDFSDVIADPNKDHNTRYFQKRVIWRIGTTEFHWMINPVVWMNLDLLNWIFPVIFLKWKVVFV